MAFDRRSDPASPVVLLLIDVVNTMSFEGSGPLVRRALPMARRLALLKKRAAASGVPTIYDICVLFTANDAYMRDYRLYVPRDCVAANSESDARHALTQMRRFLKADVRASTAIDFDALVESVRDERR